MTAPTLTDFEYQYKDNGLILNADATNAAFFDVTNIDGLDMPDVRNEKQTSDGQDGAYVYAKFLDYRLIVITGNAYAPVGTLENYLIALKASLFPDDIAYPFYIKHPGIVSDWYVMAKSLGIKYSVTAGIRNLDIAQCQIQLACEDPRIYTDNTPVVGRYGSLVSSQDSSFQGTFPVTPHFIVVGTQYFLVTNVGSYEAYPVITITGAIRNPEIANTTTGKILSFNDLVVNNSLVIDMGAGRATADGQDVGGARNQLSEFWSLASGINRITTRSSMCPSSTTISIQSSSAWV